MTESLESVLQAVAAVKPDLAAGLSGDSRIDGLRLDSLDEVEVLMALEDSHGVEIDQAQVKSCDTLGDLARLIEKQKKPARGA